LIWLDAKIDESQQDVKHVLTQLRCIVTTIDTFTDVDGCLDFMEQLEKVKVFMIISGALGQSTLPLIHDRPELDSIYVFCGNKTRHEAWAKQWPKIKGIFTKIDTLCGVLRGDTEQCNRSSISISVTTNDLNHLDPSFMYTQLLKEILIEMEYGEKQKKDFVHLCRDLYQEDAKQLQIIAEFEHHYSEYTPIWWYTQECFTYQLLNQALRTQDVRVLIKIGFFLRDVHRHIAQLHSETEHSNGVFVVYRGQGMLNDDFAKIQQCEGGLLAFNNFLSTSFDPKVSMKFARRALNNPQTVGILFKMSIDPSASSAPFAKLDNVSYFEASEKELLFSMHTVFRIIGVKMIADRLWEVNLTLNDDAADRELQRLTEHMREEVSGSTGWHRLANVLMKTGNHHDPEEIYQTLMEQVISDNDEEAIAYLYHQLARVKTHQGEYQEALDMYQKSLEIYLKSLPPSHPDLAAAYNNIGLVHEKMGLIGS
jgi:tetratricopeptide (TPR) repeat protein